MVKVVAMPARAGSWSAPRRTQSRAFRSIRQPLGQLGRPYTVGAPREADEEVPPCFTDIAAVHGAGSGDLGRLGKPLAERGSDRRHLSRAARGAGAGEDRTPRGDDRGILDEGGVGKVRLWAEPDDGESQAFERPAIGLVLLECEPQVRWTQVGRGDPRGEGVGGCTDEGMRESHHWLVPDRPLAATMSRYAG